MPRSEDEKMDKDKFVAFYYETKYKTGKMHGIEYPELDMDV